MQTSWRSISLDDICIVDIPHSTIQSNATQLRTSYYITWIPQQQAAYVTLLILNTDSHTVVSSSLCISSFLFAYDTRAVGGVLTLQAFDTNFRDTNAQATRINYNLFTPVEFMAWCWCCYRLGPAVSADIPIGLLLVRGGLIGLEMLLVKESVRWLEKKGSQRNSAQQPNLGFVAVILLKLDQNSTRFLVGLQEEIWATATMAKNYCSLQINSGASW
ncbi:hypothetical protein PMAA_039150 [Talaromyces marneffei ATCC 18224]|uniref:Uncharacterized protein n=1 Tax=Talaromyces marneffei (strain ATCC 18224 / CBS 334.59 / QM 7333) TaxID=441960 RepID=B6QPU3_TALMQ|nr:hypothetical protein PMAA_039150 [Talaromyces marneffei ATCC 18224]